MAGAKRGVALFAPAATALLLAAGCGGGGNESAGTTTAAGTTTQEATTTPSSPLAKAAYVARMKRIGRSLSTSLNTLSAANTAPKAATALTQVQKDLNAAADRIEAITPPAAVKTEHAQLAKAVRDFADEMTPIIQKLKKGSLAALSTVPNLKGLQEIQTYSTAIANKGFKIGG